MNRTLLKALLAFVPVLLGLSFSVGLVLRRRTTAAFLQFFGAACLMVVVLAHICEALGLFPSMRWGVEDSLGHYLDLFSAILGLTLYPLGLLTYLFQARR